MLAAEIIGEQRIVGTALCRLRERIARSHTTPAATTNARTTACRGIGLITHQSGQNGGSFGIATNM